MNDDWGQEGYSSSSSTPLTIPPPRRSSAPSSRNRSSRNLERHNIYEEHTRELKKQLLSTRKQLQDQQLRTLDAERDLQQVTNHLKRINDARIVALQDAAKANQELQLYRIQLESAQKEIFRAQDVLHVVDTQRYEAEKEAAQARATARQLNQEIMVKVAMEEGRKIGLQEGLQRGRHLGIQEAQMLAQFSDMEDEEGEEGEYYDDNENGSLDTFDDIDYRSRFIGSVEDVRTPEPPPPEPPQVPADPIPVPPPEPVQPIPDNRPRSFYNAPSSVRHSYVSIPPDGYIPALDADHIIRIPPPHEFSRPPPTPERMTSPPLPRLPEREAPTPRSRSRTPHRTHKPRHHNSSPGSTSTALSQFDMVNDPDYVTGRRSPLSVIAEVLSTHTSPNPQSVGPGLRHQSSWGGSSHHSNGTPYMPASGMVPSPQPDAGIYTRPRTSSSSTASLNPVNILEQDRRRSYSSDVPDINIEPPSRPPSFGTPKSQYSNYKPSVGRHRSRDSVTSGSISSHPSQPPIVLSGHNLPQGFVPNGGFPSVQSSDYGAPAPMPGGYHNAHDQASGSHLTGPPVIPAPDLYGPDSDDDLASSASVDTLTTPPPGRNRHKRTPSLDTLMTPPPSRGHRVNASEASWTSASAVPVPPPRGNGSSYGYAGSNASGNGNGNKTASKSRPGSRSTNRS